MPRINIKDIGRSSLALLKSFLRLLNPMPEIGGLEISDVALRFIQLRGEKIVSASLRLPPGIVEGGEIKDEANFLLALKDLHKKITHDNKKKLYVVAALPSEIVYSQVFEIPLLKGVNLESAVQLNLEMISPLKRGEAYYDSEQVGTREDGGFQLEYLGAFVEAEKVDRLERLLFDAGFLFAAAEFAALSLARLAKELGQNIEISRPFILLNIGNTGINFIIVRDGNLYFHYFIPWRQVQVENHNISLSILRELIQHHLQQVLNFHVTRWGAHITDLILIAPGLYDSAKKIILENFKLNVSTLALKSYSGITPNYFVALGLALRAIAPRSKDTQISLLRVGTEQEFKLNQIINFTKLWRAVIFTTAAFLVIIVGVADSLIISAQKSLSAQNERLAITTDVGELEKFQNEAMEFNNLIEVAKATKLEEYTWTVILGKLNVLAARSGVTLNRVFFQAFEVPILLNGIANNEESAVAFKNELAKEANIQKVELPLTSLESSPSGVSFSLSFTLVK